MTYAFGRLPAYPAETHPRLALGPHLRAAAPPASVDRYSVVKDWPIYLNDRLSDCTEAMVGHVIESCSAYGQGMPIEISDADVLAAYERVSGYDPADPSTDQGAVLQDVYGDWRRNGVGGHHIDCFAQVDHGNLDEVKTAVAQFGAVGLGIVVTQSMMDDFDAGRAWTYAGGVELGGHAVPVVGYDAGHVYLVTWGKVQAMTWDCFEVVTDEAWVAVLPEWFNASGYDPEGVDLYGLGEAFAELTGKANPFPKPSPGPVPPQPAPAPGDVADQDLAAAAHRWVSHRHTGTNHAFAEAVQAWLTAKGL